MDKIPESITSMTCSSCGKQQFKWPKENNDLPHIDRLVRFSEWLRDVGFSCRSCRMASFRFSVEFREVLYEVTSRFDVSLMTVNKESNVIENNISGNCIESKLKDSSEFPSLGAVGDSLVVNVLQPKVKSKANKSQQGSKSPTKRRIRPAILTQSSLHVSTGNILSLPSEDPILSSQSKPFDAPIKPLLKSNAWLSSTSRQIEQNQPQQSLLHQPSADQVINAAQKGGVIAASLIPFEEVKAPLHQLAQIYGTLFHQKLIPCYASDFAYLLRLLSCVCFEPSSSYSHWMHRCFQHLKCVVFFSSEVIKEIEDSVTSMHFHILQSFQYHTNLCKYCPQLLEKIDKIVSTHKTSFVDNDESIGDTRESLISLPFQSDRDSRHNFQTSELNRLYSNRESSRDSFLRLLRKFQNSTDQFGPNKTEIWDGLQKKSVDMLRSLDPVNMFWFAEFFTDMLLQIGLITHETDTEVLERVTDKEKLQKLHRRFSSKEGKLNKKNHKNNGSISNQLSKRPVYIHPENVFPGNQEFFWLFLTSCDSYQLTMHLSRRLSVELLNLSNEMDASTLSVRITKSRLLAKFLGFLTFSPFWNAEIQLTHDQKGNDNNSVSHLYKDAIQHSNAVQPLLPIQSLIEKASEGNNLLSVIPWVCEFFSMMKWDSFKHIESSQYICSIGILSRIYVETRHVWSDSNIDYRSNMMLISMMIEKLFDETFGWNKSCFFISTESQRECYSSERISDSAIDSCHFPVSKKFLIDILPSLDEIEKALLYQHSENYSSTMKKMRPHIVSQVQRVPHQIFPPSPPRRSKNHNIASPESSIQDRLIAAFFHQHKDLEKIANFVSDTVIRKFSLNKVKLYIIDAIDSETDSSSIVFCDPGSDFFDLAKWSVLTSRIKDIAKVAAKAALRKQCEEDIRSAMTALVVDNDELVKDVAIKLTIQHAIKKGDVFVDSLINQVETKRLLDEKIYSNGKPTIDHS